VEGLASGESFVIGTDLAPQLGIWLEGVDTNLAPSPSRYSLPADDTDGGQRLLRGVARFSAEEEADLGALHDVPDELADFATQDWRKEDRVPEADLRRLEYLISNAVAENKMLLQTDFCIHPKAVVRVETGDQPAVYVNQYSVADRLKPLVDEKIREMWEREVIEEGPPGNNYNMSLLPVLKKDSSGRYDPQNLKIRLCLNLRPCIEGMDRVIGPFPSNPSGPFWDLGPSVLFWGISSLDNIHVIRAYKVQLYKKNVVIRFFV
jgi:hypothetical protein